MVELVDTQDLKSCDLKSRAGSIPALSTQQKMQVYDRLTIKDLHFLLLINH